MLDGPLMFPLSGLGSLVLDVLPDVSGGTVILSGVLTIGGMTWRRTVPLSTLEARDFAMRINRAARVVEGESIAVPQ